MTKASRKSGQVVSNVKPEVRHHERRRTKTEGDVGGPMLSCSVRIV